MILNQAIIIFVYPSNQTSLLPAFEPLGPLGIGLFMKGLYQVDSRESSDGGSSRIKDTYEKKCPKCAPPGSMHVLNRVKSNDDMRQTCGPDHQRQRDSEHINH